MKRETERIDSQVACIKIIFAYCVRFASLMASRRTNNLEKFCLGSFLFPLFSFL